MVALVFDNRNPSQETFAIDPWRAVVYSLEYGRKHMLAILPTIWKPGFILKNHLDWSGSPFLTLKKAFHE